MTPPEADPARANLERLFPSLASSTYAIESPRDGRYNCVAWAAGENFRHWWPGPEGIGAPYWPPGVPREETMSAFIQAIQAFATLGYAPCESGTAERGYERVAIYVDSSRRPTHTARQLPSGHWSSKVGVELEDIRHELAGLENADY